VTRFARPGDRAIIRYGMGVTPLIHVVSSVETPGVDAMTACQRNVAIKPRTPEDPPNEILSDELTNEPVNCLWCVAGNGVESPVTPEIW
jgi:hypothetical protein